MSLPTYPTAIVIGGAGFIGSHLCEQLLNHHLEVVCVDNFSTGKKSHLQKCLTSPRFHLLEGNVSVSLLRRINRAHYVFLLVDTKVHSQTNQEDLANLLAGTHVTKYILELAQKFSAKFLLASTINIYEAYLSSTDLGEYFGTRQLRNSSSFSEAKRVAEAITAEFYSIHQVDARIVRLMDVYGPRMDLSSPSLFANFFRSLKTNSPFLVYNDGSQMLYPTFVTDAVEGIMKAMFTQNTSGKIITLTGPEISSLDFASTLRHLAPFHPQINFSPEPSPHVLLDPNWLKPQIELGWQPQLSLTDGLNHTIDWIKLTPLTQPKKSLKAFKASISSSSSTKISRLNIFPHHPPSGKPCQFFHFKTIILSLFLLCLLAIILPITTLSFTAFTAVSNLNQVRKSLTNGNISSAAVSSKKATTYFAKTDYQLQTLEKITSPLGLDNYFYRVSKLVNLGQNLSQASLHLCQSAEAAMSAAQIILGKNTGDALSLISESQAETTRAYELLSLASASLQEKRPNLDHFPLNSLGVYYRQLETEIPRLRSLVSTTRNLISSLPTIIGANNQKRTYLVLLQNNAELRPTGGFIGSFALLTFQNAKLLDFLVEDVYTADGQLKGHVEPPFIIKKHLGEATWYLRDVNWDPDFPTTARQAEWFLQKELGKAVDGTIGINLFVAKNLLRALGEIPLPDYNETITADNLFDRAEFHSEIDFFPGSTQKKDFLASLTRQLYARFQSLNSQDLIKLIQAINQSLIQKQITFSFSDSQLTNSLVDLNWDGQIENVLPCPPSTSCFSDYLALIESNMGVNKANFFVSRRINHEIKIFKENNLQATTTVHYTNTSSADAWPGGAYKNYLRLYVPEGSELKAITVDNNEFPLDEVDISVEHQKTVFGFLVNVPIKSQLTIQIVYKLPGKITFPKTGGPTTYLLLVQKQSGTEADPFTFNLVFPAYFKPVKTTPATDLMPQSLNFILDLSQDRLFSIDFQK